jgi:murein DD-endopeptidase MepM/ murein hydrolase activator NlpD
VSVPPPPPFQETAVPTRTALTLILLVGLLLLGACSDSSPSAGSMVITATHRPSRTPTPSPTPTWTFTPTLTPTVTPTPTPTTTPTPTPTPTPTAQPIRVQGDPRQLVLSAPAPQPGAPCGYVDTLDFPLRPPDAVGVTRGGSDFGVYRARYEGVHAGEDWWVGQGRNSSFGEPVYSIAHGQVTYAQPNGWGADRGVVIVRHTFPDGRTVLSQYGHLDPPSVVLAAGMCVARGDQVGRIGRPRTSPHLHWEIRTILPNEPGPGYYYTDPTRGGWLPPSQTVWDYRMAASPGVLWNTSSHLQVRQGLGLMSDDTYAFQADSELFGMDLLDGTIRWSQPISTSSGLLLDEDGSTVYLARMAGTVQALSLPDDPESDTPEAPALRWEVDLDVLGVPALIPLPGGGVGVSFRQGLFGISPDGEILWTYEGFPRPLYWTAAGDRLIVGPVGHDGPIWAIDESGPVEGLAPFTGRPIYTGDQVIVYAENGVYRLEPDTLAPELLYPLPIGFVRQGDILALPDGALLLAHTDLRYSRLILLEPDGQVRWERSYGDVIFGIQRLLLLGDRPYLLSRYDRSLAEGAVSSQTTDELTLFAVDAETAELTRIFVGGTRNPSPTHTAAIPVADGRVLFNIGGVAQVMLDAPAALETIAPD